MQLTPVYGPEPILVLHHPPADVVGPAIAQRRRLAATVATFTDEQWTHASRCDGWTNRDVVAHLDGTNAFWGASISAGRRGEPTRLLERFDPLATPAQMVESSRGLPPRAVLESFTRSTEGLVALLESLTDDDLAATAEAPPGHLGMGAVVHHALWDSWIHERDVMIPLGLTPVTRNDEVAACLRYVAALGPALAARRGAGSGTLAIEVSDPTLSILVEVDDHVAVRDGRGAADVRLTGDAVEIVEVLSMRRPSPWSIPADQEWMLAGLAEAFDA